MTETNEIDCVFCKNPVDGSHKCIICNNIVHVICGTGVGPEGFGQSVECFKCKPKPKSSTLTSVQGKRILLMIGVIGKTYGIHVSLNKKTES